MFRNRQFMIYHFSQGACPNHIFKILSRGTLWSSKVVKKTAQPNRWTRATKFTRVFCSKTGKSLSKLVKIGLYQSFSLVTDAFAPSVLLLIHRCLPLPCATSLLLPTPVSKYDRSLPLMLLHFSPSIPTHLCPTSQPNKPNEAFCCCCEWAEALLLCMKNPKFIMQSYIMKHFSGGEIWLPGPDELARWTNRSEPRNRESVRLVWRASDEKCEYIWRHVDLARTEI
jgi:hypothetical protein